MTRRRFACGAAAILLAAVPARAQSVQGGKGDSHQSPAPGIFGPLDAVRRSAARAGIALSVRYTSELGYNPAGGDRDRVTETGQFDFGSRFDMGQLAGLTGGTLNAVVTSRRGVLLDTAAGLGTLQQTQEIYGRGQTWRLTSLWYEQQLGRASLKAGRANVGEDFATFACDFQNLTFCGAQPGNVVDYWFNWPVSQWMGRARVTLPHGYVQLGAYEVNPRNLRKSFVLGYFHGATGVLLPVEAVWRPRPGGRAGTYRAGGWYDTSRGRDVARDRAGGLLLASGLEPAARDGRWGGWFTARQQVTGKADGNGLVDGLTIFVRATLADRRTARLDSQVTAGLFYEGLPLVSRDDSLGLAVGRTHVNGRIADAERIAGQPVEGSEYESELFYSLHPVSGIVVRPNVQYIVHPGGRRDRADAVVLGLKTAITL